MGGQTKGRDSLDPTTFPGSYYDDEDEDEDYYYYYLPTSVGKAKEMGCTDKGTSM